PGIRESATGTGFSLTWGGDVVVSTTPFPITRSDSVGAIVRPLPLAQPESKMLTVPYHLRVSLCAGLCLALLLALAGVAGSRAGRLLSPGRRAGPANGGDATVGLVIAPERLDFGDALEESSSAGC